MFIAKTAVIVVSFFLSFSVFIKNARKLLRYFAFDFVVYTTIIQIFHCSSWFCDQLVRSNF